MRVLVLTGLNVRSIGKQLLVIVDAGSKQATSRDQAPMLTPTVNKIAYRLLPLRIPF